jgi:hypothetical protein
VAFAQFCCAIFEEPDQSAIDVAEAEEAEVVGADVAASLGLKPGSFFVMYSAREAAPLQSPVHPRNEVAER